MNNYLVVILNSDYVTDFLVIRAESVKKARDIVGKLPRVLEVISVWVEVKR